MEPYLIFVLFVLFFFHRNNSYGILITLIVFASLRYNTGWDYANYEMMTKERTSYVYATETYSVPWKLLFSFCYEKGWSHLAIIIPNILTYFFVYIALHLIYKENIDKKERMCEALVVYAFWPFFYLSSFSTIRQSLAIGIILLIFACLYNKKILYAILLQVISFYIHPSSIIGIILFPLFLIPFEIKYKHIVIALILSAFTLLSLSKLIEYINIDALGEYCEIYLNQKDSFGSKLSYLLMLIFLYFSYMWKYADTQEIKLFYTIIIVAFGVEFIIYKLGFSSVITRIVSYFSIILVLEFYNSSRNIGGIHTTYVLTLLLISLFIVYLYLMDTPMAKSLSSSPYVPYTFIWDK
ncbi:MAG: EpsG family protein [Paludibacteraceae bacterium]|nr:EpsG family protein [Paludibacteraceae bacterium]